MDQQERRCLVGFHHGTLRSLVQCADGWRVASAVKPHRGERRGRQAGQYLLHATRSRRQDARAIKVSADAGQYCCAWLAAGGKAQASYYPPSMAFWSLVTLKCKGRLLLHTFSQAVLPPSADLCSHLTLFLADADAVAALALSPDLQTLATVSADQTAFLFHMVGPAQLEPIGLVELQQVPTCLAWSPNSSRLLIGTR